MVKKRILLLGAGGFIGRLILERLLSEGHFVRAAARIPEKWQNAYSGAEWVKADLNRDLTPESYEKHLRGIDTVINAAGIIRESRHSQFENVHTGGPVALFQAAAKSGIKNILQISALGSDETAVTTYHLSKKAADDYLTSHFKNPVIFRPSIVVGKKGKSTALFSAMAAMPVLFIPGDGNFQIQPVFADDLVDAVSEVIKAWPKKSLVMDATGPEVFSLKNFLIGIRRASGFRTSRVISMPLSVVEFFAKAGFGLLNNDTLTMLKRGSVSDSSAFQKLTGHSLRSPMNLWRENPEIRSFLFPAIIPAIRYATAFIWIFTGLISAFVYPAEKSFQLLMNSGIPANPGILQFFLYGSSFLDIILGIGLFTGKKSFFYVFQIICIFAYTTIVSFTMPDFWLHPFGPISKNIPLIALSFAGFFLDQDKK